MIHKQIGEKELGRDELDTEVVRTFDKEQMHCEAKVTTRGEAVSCVRIYRRIQDDYQENEA